MDRKQIFSELQLNPIVEVLVVGAGINGAGTFRDLALNGVNVLLIDRADFCSGASAASSHMAHGGIRYLENGEFRLVKEAVQERNRMIQNAPHLVRPLPTTIPIFKFWSGLFNAPLKFLGLLDKPSERGAFIIKIGLMLYDAFTKSQGTVPVHRFLGKSATLRAFPKINPQVRYSATYFDGSIISPERYTVELITDGESEGNHARALNYAPVSVDDDGNLYIQDGLTELKVEVKPKLIVNAAGPWIDQVNARFGIPSRYIGGTKGSHIVVDHPELREAIGENEIFFENKDGRIVLIFPLLDKVLIGTTDIPIENPDDAICDEDEVGYFIEMLDRVFPEIKLTKEQIIFRFSGVRPLEAQHSRTTGQITRDHSIKTNQLNHIPVLSMIGGKWTSYRAFSEQITLRVLNYLGKSRQMSTENLPIGGGANILSDAMKNWKDMDLAVLYGSQNQKIKDFPVSVKFETINSPYITQNEIAYFVRIEKVVHLDDLILRRTLLAYLGLLNLDLLQQIARQVGFESGWDTEKTDQELERSIRILRNQYGVKLQ